MKRGLLAALLLAGSSAGFCAPPSDEGLRLLKIGKFKEAVPLLEQASKAEPGSADILLNLGWAYWHVKDYGKTRSIGASLLKREPANAAFQVFLANADLDAGQEEEALKMARQAAKNAPDDAATALFLLGRHGSSPSVLELVFQKHQDFTNAVARAAGFLVEKGRNEEALRFYDKLLEVHPKNEAYRKGRAKALFALGKKPEAMTEWQNLARDETDADSMLNLGWTYIQENRLDEAWNIGHRLVGLDGKNPNFLRFLADTEMARLNYEEALRLARRAVAVAPQDPDANLALVKSLCLLQRLDEAEVLLDRLLKEYPHHIGVRYVSADFVYRRGRSAEAAARYDQLVKENPGVAQYRMGLAAVLYDMGQQDRAVGQWKLLAQGQSPNRDALRLLRDDAYNRQAYGEALAWQRRRMAAKAPDVADWIKTADIAMMLKDYVGVIRAAAMALKSDPLSMTAEYMRAEALERLQDWPGAYKAYSGIIAKNPNSIRALSGLSDSAAALGDYPEAIKYQRQADLMSFPLIVPFHRLRESSLWADAGRLGQSWRLVRAMAAQRRPFLPVLVYHGISISNRTDSTTQESFRRQMRMIKRLGYTTITATDMDRCFRNEAKLPPKPIMITFDDSRVDSFVNADPVLKELGLRATMFAIVSTPRANWHFHAFAQDLRRWQATGRWDIQAHAHFSHDPIPINGTGTMGHFFANRMWLAKENRLETRAEFRDRLEDEYKSVKKLIEEILPRSNIVALAYPYGDYGQADYSNDRQAAAINRQLAQRYYRMQFIQDTYGFNALPASPSDLARFEISKYMTADQLKEHLVMVEPWVQAKLRQADIWAHADQVGRTQGIYTELRNHGISEPQLWADQAFAFRMIGDEPRAQKFLTQAAAAETGGLNTIFDFYSRILAESKSASGPEASAEFLGFNDSQGTSISRATVHGGAWIKSAHIGARLTESDYVGPVIPGLAAGHLQGREGGLDLRFFPWAQAVFDASCARQYYPGSTVGPTDGYALTAGSQIWPQLRAEVRDGMGSVLTSAALRAGRRFHTDGAGLVWDPAFGWRATGDMDLHRFNDENQQHSYRVGLQKRILTGVDLGAAFLHDNATHSAPEYYTPQDLRQFTGLLNIRRSFGQHSKRTGMQRGDVDIRYEGGYGRDRTRSRFVQITQVQLGFRLLDYLTVKLAGEYAASPNYISRQVNAGLSLSFGQARLSSGLATALPAQGMLPRPPPGGSGGKGADHTADPDQPGGFLPAAPMEKPLPAL